jgi:hypothetical protein
LVATWTEILRSPGHAFYDRLQILLKDAGFDVFVEDVCKPVLCAESWRAVITARPLFPPANGLLFRSDRQRTRHRLALLGSIEPRQGSRSLLAVEDGLAPAARSAREVFGWVLDLVAERGLVKGERIGVDGSTMEANAALRTIVRRYTGETYRQMLPGWPKRAVSRRRRLTISSGSTASARGRSY